MNFAEYIWLDGAKPTQQLRSKTRIVNVDSASLLDAGAYPDWGFDGSSTNQSAGNSSDLELRPVRVVKDPVRGGDHVLVLCEVYDEEGQPHETNERAGLREVLDLGAGDEDPWFGFEQEYTLLQNGRPLGFPGTGYPEPQGPYYCGVGAGVAYGREIVERHAEACLQAGLMLYGINAEVMPGQWEFQIGYRGMSGENADPLLVSDHLWLARWILHRIAEEFGVSASFDVKPMKGDWNGAGAHTNFSVRSMRDGDGLRSMEEAVRRLERAHGDHIRVYGDALAERLTGLHETCSIEEFRSGVADRGSSIRIPRHVAASGRGYLEDRRPGANVNPYAVCARILRTICDLDAATRKAA